ncbi:hypothetical protein E2320_006330 [Naja naja]|nr:hypothetical protein E2320_006330 [Naja naja]
MEKLTWSCVLLFALFGQLWSIPRPSQKLPAWSPVNDEDAALNLEPLTSRSFQQTLTGRLGEQTEDYPSDAGAAPPSSFNAKGHSEEAPIESFFQNMLLRRLWESARKQYTKRKNYSQCFWKYCV